MQAKRSDILVINSSFPEVNHLAAALASELRLSTFIRPYANMGRPWEKSLSKIPGLSRVYSKTFGRRTLPQPLSPTIVKEVAIIQDLAIALHNRLPINNKSYRAIRQKLIYALNNAVASASERTLSSEAAVVGSWHVSYLAFEKAQHDGIARILNYPLAHHAFTHDLLSEEAEREPEFAATLNSHQRPNWEIDRLDHEIHLANKILLGSSFVKNSFIASGVPKEKLVVVPYGVNTSLFTPPAETIQSKHFNVLFVGQLSQRKGISYLLRAYKKFRQKNTQLTLIGQLQDDGTALQPWQHLFTHIPHIPRHQLSVHFQQADVFVFPTLVEGMPLVVIEAMASGLPVITTPNGPGDSVRDGVDGFLVPPRDPDAIIEKLELLKSDTTLRQWMSTNAKARAQEYTWENYRQHVISVLQNF